MHLLGLSVRSRASIRLAEQPSLSTVPPLLNIAVRAARRAGEVIVRSMNRLESLTIATKGRNDFVTEVDRACELAIVETIRSRYPAHDIVTEETDLGRTGAREVWFVDPLDGTVNFAHSYPCFCASVASPVHLNSTTCLNIALPPYRNHDPEALYCTMQDKASGS